jgi:hypothetical protein
MQPKLTAKALCGDQEVGKISKVIIDANHRYTFQSKKAELDPQQYGFQFVGWDE